VLMICEIAHAPRKIHDTNYRDHVKMKNLGTAVGHMLETRATVMLTAHYGNFEVSGFLAGLLGFPTYTVVRPLDNRFVDQYLTSFRGATGQYVLPKQGSAGQVSALLAAGGILAILGDQYAGPKGCWVEFFGRPASCHKAISLFSLTSGASMVVMYTKRLGGKPLQFEMGFTAFLDPQLPDAPCDVRGITQWYSRSLEEIVRADPHQYWWVHRRWKDTRVKRRRKDRQLQTDPPQTEPAKTHLAEAVRSTLEK
jgi:KDO2-lipid IV(A) lauroyltransferase